MQMRRIWHNIYSCIRCSLLLLIIILLQLIDIVWCLVFSAKFTFRENRHALLLILHYGRLKLIGRKLLISIVAVIFSLLWNQRGFGDCLRGLRDERIHVGLVDDICVFGTEQFVCVGKSRLIRRFPLWEHLAARAVFLIIAKQHKRLLNHFLNSRVPHKQILFVLSDKPQQITQTINWCQLVNLI